MSSLYRWPQTGCQESAESHRLSVLMAFGWRLQLISVLMGYGKSRNSFLWLLKRNQLQLLLQFFFIGVAFKAHACSDFCRMNRKFDASTTKSSFGQKCSKYFLADSIDGLNVGKKTSVAAIWPIYGHVNIRVCSLDHPSCNGRTGPHASLWGI